jgi:hypothetical protein
MMNGLQTLSYWRDYFNHPAGSMLGLFNASMSLGSILGLAFVPYTIDRVRHNYALPSTVEI